ncbi:DUF397 domain-containing protein [Sphaerisporangium rubeum]|uniref:DUF397 domain-containing protein n=1 Tax=Sphaerisporangium rubeum TaxID=321317 RepID=UPI00161A2466|nr:DUF397 domain-containing protein [Sphaerisporangium rubeum]
MVHDLHGARWRKSSQSADDNCVEVASNLPGIFAVRDSKNPVGLAVVVPRSEWSAFLNAVRSRPLSG